MRFVYRIIAAIIYFVFWPYGRIKAASGSKLWSGRLGLISDSKKFDIWLHAASVGETKIAGYLIDYLVHKNPKLQIYLTTMTVSGQSIGEEFSGANVTAGYFPIDSVGPIERTLKSIKPKMLVITETEIWPTLVDSAFDKNISIVLVNGRMSDRAFVKYKFLSVVFEKILSKYDRIFVKTKSDADKYKSFQLSDDVVMMAGDMKFDAPLLVRDDLKIKNIRKSIGAENGFVLVAGSTRPGEERQLLELSNKLRLAGLNLRLVMAPRHLERLDEIKSEINASNMTFATYGSNNGIAPVILVEQMGLLNELYQAADLAFVGGTLVEIGGHNILEPVWAGTPVVFGPHVGNIMESKDYVLEHQYGAMAGSIDEIADIIKTFNDNRQMFRIKTEEELSHSPTATVGDYILKKLENA